MQYSTINCRTVFQICNTVLLGFPGDSHGKESACSAGNLGLIPGSGRSLCWEYLWVGKIPWRRKWQPTPVFLPGESHGIRSLLAIVHSVTKSWT